MLKYNPPFSLINILAITLLGLVIYFLINIGNNYVSDDKKIKINNKKIIPVLLGLFILLALISLIKKHTILSDMIYTIVFSVILAYLFNPLINYLQKKNIKRIWGVLILYLFIALSLMILAFLVIPRSSTEIKRLISDIPKYMEKSSDLMDRIYSKYYSAIGDLPPLFQGIQEVFIESIMGLQFFILNALKIFVEGIINTFSKVVSIVITPILTFYFLVDKDYFKEKLTNLIPKNNRKEYKELFKKIDILLSKFIRGKLIMAAFVSVVTSIFLLVLKVDFAIVIGFITGIADIIPYIGPLLGFIFAVLFAFISNPIKAIWVAVFFVLIQWIGNNILGPKIIGDTTGIHPMIILLSIIVGGGVFGVLGMILAVPAVGISIILFKFFKEKIRKPKGGR